MKRAITTATLSLLLTALIAVPASAGRCGSGPPCPRRGGPGHLPLAEEAGFTTLVAAVKAAGLEAS